MLYRTGSKLTTLVTIGFDGTGTCSCKANYHTITATTAPCRSMKYILYDRSLYRLSMFQLVLRNQLIKWQYQLKYGQFINLKWGPLSFFFLRCHLTNLVQILLLLLFNIIIQQKKKPALKSLYLSPEAPKTFLLSSVSRLSFNCPRCLLKHFSHRVQC